MSKYQHYFTPNKFKGFYYYKLAKNSFLRIVKLDLSHNSKLSIVKNKITFYHFVLDKSGSMGNCREKSIKGFNSQSETIKQLQTEFSEQE